MTDDRENVEQLTDEEFATMRQMRFGTLPTRIAPTDMVETVRVGIVLLRRAAHWRTR